MDEMPVSRRNFLQTAAAGAAVAAAGTVFPTLAKGMPEEKKKAEEKKPDEKKMGLFVCSVCGHVEFGAAPEFCPVCHSPKDQFKQNDALFADNDGKLKELAISHAPAVSVKKESSLITEKPTGEALVRIGKKLHPMEEKHFIRFIDCYSDDKHVARISLTIGAEPAAEFFVKNPGAKIRIVSWCNLHGYWQAEV
jgi:superoxide reductase